MLLSPLEDTKQEVQKHWRLSRRKTGIFVAVARSKEGRGNYEYQYTVVIS
jgi:hypothetical protein